MIVESDGRNRKERITSHRSNRTIVKWGSIAESKTLFDIEVRWNEGEEKPTLLIAYDENVIANVHAINPTPRNVRGTGWGASS
jgi:hypothetical protein